MHQTKSISHFLVVISSLRTICLVVKRALFGISLLKFYLIFIHKLIYFCVYFSNELMGTMLMHMTQRSESPQMQWNCEPPSQFCDGNSGLLIEE